MLYLELLPLPTRVGMPPKQMAHPLRELRRALQDRATLLTPALDTKLTLEYSELKRK
jgi:hypothetical protein